MTPKLDPSLHVNESESVNESIRAALVMITTEISEL